MSIKTNEGNLIANGQKFSIVVDCFNEFISNRLLEGAIDGITRHGAEEPDVEIAWVPVIPGFTPRAWNICSIDKVQCYFL
jgi:6,7-dimethyl-8-ribityllumazine synthase